MPVLAGRLVFIRSKTERKNWHGTFERLWNCDIDGMYYRLEIPMKELYDKTDGEILALDRNCSSWVN